MQMATGSMRYKVRVVLVTGGSRGIGKGCVQEFVKNGAKVAFCSIEEKEGTQFQKELDECRPGQACFIFCDVTDEANVKILISKTVERYGRIDCLVNNAGTHPPYCTIDETSSDEFKDLLNLNVVGYFLTSKYALPHLRKTQGNIINISSLVGKLGAEGAVLYVATKGAVTSMTKALAIDEAKYNVRVNSISPSSVWTPLFESLAIASGDPEGLKQTCADFQLLGRYGTPEECGQACLFLASEGTFCTGVDLNLSGGAELNYGFKNRQTGPLSNPN